LVIVRKKNALSFRGTNLRLGILNIFSLILVHRFAERNRERPITHCPAISLASATERDIRTLTS
jgi:hypothetical protein